MAKPSDILNKTGGSGGASFGGPKNTIKINPPEKGGLKAEKGESIAAHKPDLGHNLHKGGKAQGGGGQSSARPKV